MDSSYVDSLCTDNLSRVKNERREVNKGRTRSPIELFWTAKNQMMMINCYVVNLYKQSNTTMIMTSNLGDCDSHRQHDHRSLHVRLWSRQVKPNYIEILPTSKEKMHLKKYVSLTLLTILKFTTNILTFSPSPS